ncbi:MAG: ribosomal protein S18 acetylase RimI-like enzyme [Patiriisocius sp.]|jgi:ribosomal protein S18 acetylase RimI-like enzyme
MNIIQATLENIKQLVPLFDGYRVFYKQESNLAAAEAFLTARFQQEDAIILLALDSDQTPMGFTQLYPSFSSVSMQRTYILNDLYVAGNFRKKGVGEALLNTAKKITISKKAKGLTLETDLSNPAQHLYERLDWKKDTHVLHYTWETGL